MTGDWDPEAFESAVGKDELMVEQFKRMNNVWLEALKSFEGNGLDLDAHDLEERIDNFVLAFEHVW